MGTPEITDSTNIEKKEDTPKATPIGTNTEKKKEDSKKTATIETQTDSTPEITDSTNIEKNDSPQIDQEKLSKSIDELKPVKPVDSLQSVGPLKEDSLPKIVATPKGSGKPPPKLIQSSEDKKVQAWSVKCGLQSRFNGIDKSKDYDLSDNFLGVDAQQIAQTQREEDDVRVKNCKRLFCKTKHCAPQCQWNPEDGDDYKLEPSDDCQGANYKGSDGYDKTYDLCMQEVGGKMMGSQSMCAIEMDNKAKALKAKKDKAEADAQKIIDDAKRKRENDEKVNNLAKATQERLKKAEKARKEALKNKPLDARQRAIQAQL